MSCWKYDSSHGWASEERLTQKGTFHESRGYVKCFFASCQCVQHFQDEKKQNKTLRWNHLIKKSFLLSATLSSQIVRGLGSLLEAVGLFLIYSELVYWLENIYKGYTE